uniref:polyadenylate-binding protein-interacting protein 3 n=1 Tax=Erigeron canadensis TaxID=72917 RepID=UPI001CB9499A|nr:polyadenylate-binding protein-interacting protein 3 [Erigeron canadensis]XP_043624260.1 polyadenylate-binding protein-interacting protein 3 [Erigeron canadensis]
MNPQQVAQSRSSANGFNRRRGEKEMGGRVENKSQPGKSNFSRTVSGNNGGVESPSRDRLVYVTACLIGHQVDVQVIDGSVISGIFHATNAEKDFGIILKMARVTKAGSSRGQKNVSDVTQKPPSKTLVIPANDLVQIVAKSVSVTRDGFMNELQHNQLHDIMIDSSISQSRHVDLERELEPWVPDDDNPECPELDNTFDSHWNRGWDQFEANATLFGVKSTFNEELYTTKLDRGPQMREREREALRIAREIEGEDTQDLHLAEERGIRFHGKFELDEETKYSSVSRGVDDSGYAEDENILDSQNSETFGDVSDPMMNKSFTDLTIGKSNNESQLPSSFSTLIEVQSSHLNTSTDFLPSSSLDGQTSIQDNQVNQQHTVRNTKEDIEKHMLYERSQASKFEETSLGSCNESGDKGPSVTANVYAPSNMPSKAQETKSFSEVSEGTAVSVKINGPGVSRARPASSASSTSESGNAAPPAAASAPGLSPSSSMGSLTSEKSTLNPHAKEFRLNPNAKSFVPSPAPVRAVSPVSDGSFYYPANVGGPHMHGMPVGIGMGPSFPPNQPAIFGPQGTPLPSQQAYYSPNGPHYPHQMLLSQPRQVVYIPAYPPEMPYKGRDF